MKLAKIVGALALIGAASGAVAADQSVSFVGDKAVFNSVGSLFVGGDDVITFTGLASGMYKATLTFSSTLLNVDWNLTKLNGNTGTFASLGSMPGVFDIGFINYNPVTSPLTLTLFGSAPNAQQQMISSFTGMPSEYKGTLTVAAVPEPETYAMFLAGLGIIGAIAKRRSRA